MAESRGAEPPATVPFAAHRVGWTDDEANAYLARVRRVVDGDTLVVTVDLGFAVEVGQTLRLRGIDGPELSRQAGERAREFVRQALLLGVAHLESSKTESTASRSAARRDPPEALDFLLPLSRLLRLEA
jgi:endonuclease YncB( thermonuclease family)